MANAQVVTGQVGFSLSVTETVTSGQVNASGNSLTNFVQQVYQYVNNNGVAYGVDQLYAKQITLASTSQTIHFQTATANDPFGNSLAMLRIRDLVIQVVTVTSGLFLKVYAPASNAITWLPPVANFLSVRAGSVLWVNDSLSFGGGVGNVVGASTDGLTLDSGSSTITFNIVAVGNATA
jgi:hypothetical protein